MKGSITVKTTPKGAARLLLLNDVCLTEAWTFDQASAILDALQQLKISEILCLIDGTPADRYIGSADIPQFGSIEALIQVPELVYHSGQLNYPQLGFALKKDMNAKLEANIKFGENHGKGATLLGLTDCVDGKFVSSALTNVFVNSFDYQSKQRIVEKLCFRIPLIQLLLRKAKDEVLNGYSFMGSLSVSTKKRRSQCIRRIFRSFSAYDDEQLTSRLHNIKWE